MIRTPKPWVRINDLSSMYPEGQFRTVALDAARRFVSDMERQGLTLITPEADMLVYGPVRHRDFSKPGVAAPTWRPAPDSDPTYRTVGWELSEAWTEDAEDFLLRAEFLAKKVHMVEYVIRENESA
jgi:hypothetical protein